MPLEEKQNFLKETYISSGELIAIKELRKDHDLAILPADKGRATVAMDRSAYKDKLNFLLSNQSTYSVLQKDPTPSLQRKMNGLLLDLNKNGRLTPHEYDRLRCTCGSTPSLNGLPKIHKPDVPLRPIVSFYSSPTYNLSKHLAFLLSSLVGNSSSAVRNSRDFAHFIQQEALEADEVLVSFDVISLFTCVPISLALDIAKECLEQDETLSDHTFLTVSDNLSLLSLCLNATYF